MGQVTVVYAFDCDTWEAEAGATSSQDSVRGTYLRAHVHQAGVQLSGKKHGWSPGFHPQTQKSTEVAFASPVMEHVSEACPNSPGHDTSHVCNSAEQTWEHLNAQTQSVYIENGLHFTLLQTNTPKNMDLELALNSRLKPCPFESNFSYNPWQEMPERKAAHDSGMCQHKHTSVPMLKTGPLKLGR